MDELPNVGTDTSVRIDAADEMIVDGRDERTNADASKCKEGEEKGGAGMRQSRQRRTASRQTGGLPT